TLSPRPSSSSTGEPAAPSSPPARTPPCPRSRPPSSTRRGRGMPSRRRCSSRDGRASRSRPRRSSPTRPEAPRRPSWVRGAPSPGSRSCTNCWPHPPTRPPRAHDAGSRSARLAVTRRGRRGSPPGEFGRPGIPNERSTMRRKRGLITLGVIVGVLALLVGGLYWAGRSLFYEPTARGVDSVIGEIGGTRVLGVFAHPDDEQTV